MARMARMLWAAVVLVLPLLGLCQFVLPPEWVPEDYPATEVGAESFVTAYNTTAELVTYQNQEAGWTYQTNITAHNSNKKVGLLPRSPFPTLHTAHRGVSMKG